MENRKSIFAAVSVIAVSLGLLGIFKFQENSYNQKLAKAQTELATQKKALKAAQKAERQKLQAKAETEASSSADQLFRILFTYSSQVDWTARTDKAKQLVSDDILNNKAYFNDGKDDTGESIIDTMQLQSSFISANTGVSLINESNNTVDCVSVVKYAAQYGSERSATTTMVYTSTYDLTQHKFTKLQKLGSTMVDATNNQ